MDETQPLLPPATDDYGPHRQQDKIDGRYTLDFDPNGDSDNPQEWSPLAFMAFSVTFNRIWLVPVANNIVADLDGSGGRQSSSTASVLLVTI